jgi:2-desacetyl-2-hydroxyethyl bacteriochlorophyllide A dehydrogenase
MHAVRLEGGQLDLQEMPAPSPAAGEAVVAVSLAGICGTDRELLAGYAGFRGVPGHEFVGTVHDAGDTAFRPGQRVVGEINVRCGECEACRRGIANHCERREVIGVRGRDGAFATYVRVPAANLHVVPDVLTDEQAVFTEPLAAALQVPEQVEIAPGMRVLIVGAGKLGQLLARVIVLHAVDLQVVARHESHRVALTQAGATPVSSADVAPRQADVVIEATGSPSGLETALAAVRPRGTVVLKSTFHDRVSLALSDLVVDEVTLVGSRCGAFEQALAAMVTGQVDPRSLIDAVYPLTDYRAAFAAAGRPGALKVLMDPRAGGPRSDATR